MPKIRFKATPGFYVYHDNPNFYDGEIRDVSEEKYNKLLKDFPDNFFSVEEKLLKPEKNKMISGKKNK